MVWQKKIFRIIFGWKNKKGGEIPALISFYLWALSKHGLLAKDLF